MIIFFTSVGWFFNSALMIFRATIHKSVINAAYCTAFSAEILFSDLFKGIPSMLKITYPLTP